MMRLRSSQFVMLLLLACSVQVGEAYAFRLMAGHVLHTAAALPDGALAAQNASPRTMAATYRANWRVDLSPEARSVERTAWSVPYPLAASAAVASFTGLLRASK